MVTVIIMEQILHRGALTDCSPDRRQELAQGGIETVLKPFDMPVSHTTPDDFGLGDRDHNRQQLERLLVGPHKVLHSDDHVLLGMSTHASLIETFVYRRAENVLTYYLRSEIAELGLLGSAATKVALWRRAGPGLVGGTSRIIFNLLDDYGAIVSHGTETYDGHRFWLDRMAEAHQTGWTVGVTDWDSLVPYTDEQSLFDWVQAHSRTRDSHKPQGSCYFIAKRRPTKNADRT